MLSAARPVRNRLRGESGRRRAFTRCRWHRVPDWAPGQGWPGRRPHHGRLLAVICMRGSYPTAW